jgi:hypothetical protein
MRSLTRKLIFMPKHLTKRFFKSLFNFYAEASDKNYNFNAVASYKVLVMKYGKIVVMETLIV